jgi:hypothetical protein
VKGPEIQKGHKSGGGKENSGIKGMMRYKEEQTRVELLHFRSLTGH